jgi:hypothetical protein
MTDWNPTCASLETALADLKKIAASVLDSADAIRLAFVIDCFTQLQRIYAEILWNEEQARRRADLDKQAAEKEKGPVGPDSLRE